MTEAMKAHRSSDVSLACHCLECGGAGVRISARRYKAICRLPSPAHEQAIHRAVRQETR